MEKTVDFKTRIKTKKQSEEKPNITETKLYSSILMRLS